jgi:hypothetical protein
MPRITCNLCGETRDFEQVYSSREEARQVVRCRGCGLVFFTPMLTLREFLDYSSTRHLSSIPTDAQGNYADIPAELTERWQKQAKANIDYLATFCEPVKSGGKPHVIQVGCGYGANLEEVHRRCPQATLSAVEPNPRFHKLLRQRLPDVHVFGKTLEALSGIRMLFDCIICAQFLERSFDPTYLCRRLHALLAPTGSCLIVTQNMVGTHGHVYDLSRLYYFTEGTLHALLTKCHLDVVRLDIRGEFGLAGDDLIYAVARKK